MRSAHRSPDNFSRSPASARAPGKYIPSPVGWARPTLLVKLFMPGRAHPTFLKSFPPAIARRIANASATSHLKAFSSSSGDGDL